MRDVGRNAGRPGDVVNLAHAGGSVRAVAPHVGHVDAVLRDDRLAERGDLAGVGIEAGDVIQPGRQPDGPGVHPLAHQLLHGAELVVAGGSRIEPHDLHPDVAVGDQVGHVDRHAAVEASQVFVDRPPVVREAGRVAVEAGRVAPHVVERRGRRRGERAAVLADEIGRHALAQRRQMDRIGQEHEVAVDVGVDEAGDDVAPGDVEHARSLRAVEPADLGDHRVEQRHVGAKRRPARAVDHPAALQDQVECHGDCLRFGRLWALAASGDGAAGRSDRRVGALPDVPAGDGAVRPPCSARAWQSRGLGSSASP